MASDGRISVSDTSSLEDLHHLDDLLDQDNIERTGIRDARLLAVMLRSADGDLYAGLHGHSWGGCCEIRTLWVAEGHRRQGIGTRLMAAVEEEAVRRGCGLIVLTTHSFQAPAFYEKRGFHRLASVEDYPRGYANILMVKQLSR
ncbi:N-acetyltransferase [Labrys miyagiensis]|uniref:N-acetyltransferase n=1 Tax=Labrys miyagiensis TaxID=346912 RepID=A0ABQ6CDT2_9HYPH|nr:GNAT family N-acetyltransferase [Labrys miyagiensis]GLS18421.1 N-acetyltransferase [Labrys miyagiensis]